MARLACLTMDWVDLVLLYLVLLNINNNKLSQDLVNNINSRASLVLHSINNK